MKETSEMLERLNSVIDSLGPVAVAVSGGVDSLTLAVAVHRRSAAGVEMFHAVSPAVPEAATERVQAMASAQGWSLRVVEADEFSDAEYLANPVDRCFYCKRDLYVTISELTTSTIVSGTNLDDLADYRPGLSAAEKHGVRHPFVEAEIAKGAVRSLASELGLGDVADLPAAPCLSSRVETGLVIRADWLRVIELVEMDINDEFGPRTVRCRIRAGQVALELDPVTIRSMSIAVRERVCASAAARWREVGVDLPVSIDAYRMGSAFLRVIS